MSMRYDYKPSIKPASYWLPIVLLLTIFYASFNVNAHTAFTSFTRIDFDSETHTLDLSVQMHVHEMEALLTDITGKELSFKNVDHESSIAATLSALIPQHISLRVNTSSTDIAVVGFEQKKDTVFIYVKGETDDRPNLIEFNNSILFDHNREQINSVMAVVDENRKAGEVTIESGPITLEF